ncbi:hypothetical protein BD560DRAFT_391641 [Blakeslea trispora]|nr:hypothetical protein BD560DRAFT_391641 [Blakeslea trispora]
MSKADKFNLLWQDIAKWQKDIDAKDQIVSGRKPVHDQSLPPIRPSIEINVDTVKPIGLALLDSKKSVSTPVSKPPSISEKAEAEKAEGNKYFVKNDYQNAIRHYGRAIELNPTVPVYFVNRAMAYLKTNSFLEAEKDCTQGLLLQPKNVKALWRRAIALKGLGRIAESRKDLEHALMIEPNNTSILDELKKLPKPTPKSSVTKNKTLSVDEKQKVRLPVHVIDAAYVGPKGPAKVTPITPSKPPTNKEPVKAEKAEPVKAEAALTSEKLSKPDALPKATLPLKFTTPRTNYEFERDWKTYKARGDDILYQYFQCIPPSSYANLFKSSLESGQFEKMIDLLEAKYSKEKSPQEIFEVMQGLSQVKRLDMLIMFLDKKRQRVLQSLFNLMKHHCGESITQEKLSKLAKVYDIHI